MQVTLPHLLARHQLIPKTHCHLHTSGLVVDNNLINCNIIIIIIIVVIIIINEFQSDFQCPGNFFPAEVKRIPCYRKLTLNSFLRKKSQPGEPNTFLRICHNHIRVTQIHIQMLKYTNTQIHKYSNIQIHKYIPAKKLIQIFFSESFTTALESLKVYKRFPVIRF